MFKLFRFLLVAMVFVVSVCYVSGAVENATLTEISDGKYDSGVSAGSNLAEGGNVTKMNLSSASSTTRWQGYYGNVTGALRLGLGTNILYNFGNGANVKYVFATQNPNFNFANLQTTTAAQVDTQWGYSTGVDQAVDIYTESSIVNGITTISFRTLPVTSFFNSTAFDNGANTAKTDYAFGAIVNSTGAPSFDGTNANYQLMVPATGTETYYFFMDVN